KSADSRVGVAAVNMAWAQPLCDLQPTLYIRVAKRDTMHHRHLRRAMRQGFLLAGPNGACADAGIFLIFHHRLLSSLSEKAPGWHSSIRAPRRVPSGCRVRKTAQTR